ncbi:hypothetical protein [Streptomyces sp. NPDC051909]|uniref:hypothetical protein n=1 Tax=Streptomyces sp. NPDC051909 TaxID=3154944 RepID=UPI003447E682
MDASVSYGWQAPSAVERGLYEARQRGDWPAYYDLVAQADLFMAQSRVQADTQPDKIRFHPYWNPQTRSMCVAAYTAGMLSAPVPDPVFFGCSLGWFADVWEPHDTTLPLGRWPRVEPLNEQHSAAPRGLKVRSWVRSRVRPPDWWWRCASFFPRSLPTHVNPPS